MRVRQEDTDSLREISYNHPMPVRIANENVGDSPVAVRTPIHSLDRVPIPGIGTGSAYAAGDAFGSKVMLAVPKYGTISHIIFHDLDDEGLAKELVLFDRDFTATADNSAFSVSDVDLVHCIGVVNVLTYYNFNSNQVGIGTPALSYHAPYNRLYAQFVTRGADNIAAGSLPTFKLVIDE